MPILFTKIQFHDHPAAFTVAEFFLAVAAEFSFRFRYIAVQRFLQFLRDAAPWNDIAHARIPHIHDAGPFTVLIGQNQVHQKHIRKRCPLILCLLPSALRPKLVQCPIQVIFWQRGLVQQDMQFLLHRPTVILTVGREFYICMDGANLFLHRSAQSFQFLLPFCFQLLCGLFFGFWLLCSMLLLGFWLRL